MVVGGFERNDRDLVGFNYISGLVLTGDVDCIGLLEDGIGEGWRWPIGGVGLFYFR